MQNKVICIDDIQNSLLPVTDFHLSFIRKVLWITVKLSYMVFRRTGKNFLLEKTLYVSDLGVLRSLADNFGPSQVKEQKK